MSRPSTLTEAVVASFARTPDERLKEILVSLTRHLHDFVRDVELSEVEWQLGVDFLTRVGHQCDPVRQEFILLSDVLGVSMLVDGLTNQGSAGATESTVLGPFHLVDSQARALGDSIAPAGAEDLCVVRGRVTSLDGAPLPDATVDVWQADREGLYDVQKPEGPPEQSLRGLFRTDSDGSYWFRTVIPRHYPIPDDGPVGELLRSALRHPNRPAHIHFIADAAGHRPVTTHLFVAGSEFIDDDAVFAVKESLVREVRRVEDAAQAARYGVPQAFDLIEFDIVLTPR